MITSIKHEQNTSTQTIDSRSIRRRRVLLGIFYVAALVVLAVLFVDGWSYYTTPFSERPHHDDYRALRPAGSRGLIYGIIGASMMILMLIYTLQKRFKLFSRRLPLWPFLDIHIFFGVIGPIFVILHTSFKIQGLVAISFWSMIAVALSGYLGRYLYQQIPRNINDKELSLDEIDKLGKQLSTELDRRTGIDAKTLSGINRLFEHAFTTYSSNFGMLIFKLIVKDIQRPWIKRHLRRKIRRIRRLSRREVDAILDIATRRALLKRRLLVLGKVHQLFHYWHVIHKPFAIIMYIIMFVHIGVAVWMGYAWIG